MCICFSDKQLDELLDSTCYFLLVIKQIVLAMFILGYMIYDPKNFYVSSYVFFAEFLLSITYTIDILIRIMRHRCEYFIRLENLFDFLIYILIVGFFVWMAFEIIQDLKEGVKSVRKSLKLIISEHEGGYFNILYIRKFLILLRLSTLIYRAKSISEDRRWNKEFNDEKEQINYQSAGGTQSYQYSSL